MNQYSIFFPKTLVIVNIRLVAYFLCNSSLDVYAIRKKIMAIAK